MVVAYVVLRFFRPTEQYPELSAQNSEAPCIADFCYCLQSCILRRKLMRVRTSTVIVIKVNIVNHYNQLKVSVF